MRTKSLITFFAAALISNLFANTRTAVISEGYNIFVDNALSETTKLEIREGYDNSDPINASINLPGKSKSVIRLKNMGKMLQVKNMQGNLIGGCLIYDPARGRNMLQIDIGQSSCTLSVRYFPITNSGVIVDQGVNFRLYNAASNISKLAIMNNGQEQGFVNLTYQSWAHVALNLQNNTTYKHLAIIANNANSSTTNEQHSCYRELSVNGQTNFVGFTHLARVNGRDYCQFSTNELAVTKRQNPLYCSNPIGAGVNWSLCDKDRIVFNQQSNMEKSNLEYAVLGNGSVLDGNWKNANLSHMTLIHGTIIGRDSGYRNRYGFPISTFNEVNLSYTTLNNSHFQGFLPGLDLTNANLENTIFQGAIIPGIKLKGANLNGANFKGANLVTSIFPLSQGTDLRGVDFKGADFSGAKLSGSDFTGAINILDPNKFIGAEIYGITWVDGKSYRCVRVINGQFVLGQTPAVCGGGGVPA